MRHLRITASILGYSAVVIFFFRVIPYTWISDEHFLNSITSYYIIGVLFLGLVFIKGVDSLEYFRLPEINAQSITAMTVVAMMVSPQFLGGQNEMKPWSVAVPGIIFLIGIAFGEEMFARGFLFGILRKYGQTNAIIFSSVVFGLMHLNLYTGENWELWNAYSHVVSSGVFGVIAAQVMIMTRSIWVSVILHTFSNWFIVFEKVIEEEAGTESYPPYSLFDNLVGPLSEFLIYGPIVLFLARVNRGGWPRWIEKLALRFKLIVPESAVG
jgi:membrane protease YdiL (CAAX protease family)